ncbi:MAG TPA: hypothetical protein VM661_16890 [Candidatus Sulfotelmatobacter sp.]|nr:hypothetical protein [Candidatus Sulfotelmatobacter sp.]
MMEGLDLDGIQPEEREAFLAYSDKAVGTNINPQTLLATDYLNHFNEIIMMLEMIPDVPECLEEAREWQPKSYQDHFRDSQFRDKELAIEAYDHVPSKFRAAFENVISQMNALVAASIDHIAEVIEGGNPEELRFVCSEASRGVQKLMDLASAVIHGSSKILDQSEIDGFLAH